MTYIIRRITVIIQRDFRYGIKYLEHLSPGSNNIKYASPI